MKRTDLHAGQTVYYAPGSTYMERDGFNQGKAKVVMVAARDTRGRFDRGHNYVAVTPDEIRYTKSHALIEVERAGFSPLQLLVGLTTLRGEYDEVAARVEAYRAERDAANATVLERERRTAEDTRALAAKLRDLLGLPQPATLWDGGHGVRVSQRAAEGRIELDREAARKIIADLEAHRECPLTPSGASAE